MPSYLPFEVASDHPPLQLGSITIPRLGCLTVAESIALDQLLPDALDLVNMASGSFTTSVEAHLQTLLAALLLISRNSPNWTLESVRALPIEQQAAASKFFLQERQRWNDAPAAEPTPAGKKVEVDWARIIWRLQANYPGNRRFDDDNFGNCPLLLVESALEAIADRELQHYSALALPIALIGAHWQASKGAKDPSTETFNPYGRQLRKQAAKAQISPTAARTFLQLSKDRKLPPWVVTVVNIEQIRIAAED